MNLLILEKPVPDTSPGYRGTDRFSPPYLDHLSDQHPANQAFVWYAEEYGGFGVIHNLEKAIRLVREYERLDPPQHFELIEVASPDQPFESKEHTFIGFDLSAFYSHSLIFWGLEYNKKDIVIPDIPKDDNYWDILPLIILTYKHFLPMLNSYGLFNDFEVADECLTCLMALQKIHPNQWDEGFVFEVVKLAIVPIPEI